MFSTTKAALTRQLAFSLMLISVLISCKNNTVDSGYVNESKVVVDTLFVTNLTESAADPYLGKLTYTPVGHFDDPLFGELESVAFIQPSIAFSSSDSTLTADHFFHLRLYVYQSIQYGDTLSNPSFSIYRVTSPWRGTTFKMSDEITTEAQIEANKVGTFALNDVDTTNIIDVPLSGSWVSDYRSYYNSSSSLRDSTYRYSDFGLAIVPEQGTERMAFFGMGSSQLMIFEADTSADTLSQAMVDWGYDLTRGEDSAPAENITLFSTLENYLAVDFSEKINEIEGPNFVRAELVLTEDSLRLSSTLTPGETRTDYPDMRLRLTSASDLAYDLAFNSTSSLALYSDGKYRFNLTSLFNANIFGSTDLDNLYVYAAPNSGVLGFNTFYGVSASRRNAPKLLIYRLETEE